MPYIYINHCCIQKIDPLNRKEEDLYFRLLDNEKHFHYVIHVNHIYVNVIKSVK